MSSLSILHDIHSQQMMIPSLGCKHIKSKHASKCVRKNYLPYVINGLLDILEKEMSCIM